MSDAHPAGCGLTGSDGSLATAFDLVMLDLDGVVYVGSDGVPGAAEHLAAAREAGARLAFVTNNASRPPQTVVDHLREVGVPAVLEDVVTSAQAAAALIRSTYGDGAAVLPLGGAGLLSALAEAGLRTVALGEDPDLLVTGYGPDVLWRDIMAAAVAVRDGLDWVATNTDGTIPTPYGLAPGHGVLVAMLERFAGRSPQVAGKPSPPLLQTAIERADAQRPLMVGDRLDTDIDGGRAVGVPTLLVMTGVSDAAALVACPPGERPTFVGADLSALLEPQSAVTWTDDAARVGGWTATLHGDAVELSGDGTASDWWRALAVAGWAHLDATGKPADVADLRPPA